MRNFVAAILLSLIASMASASIVHVVVDDTIQPVSEAYIARAIDSAVAAHDDAVLIELRTPGGLDSSMRAIVRKILESPVPVIVFVGPAGSRAASAGFFILQAADIAAMAPGTNTGAAHPVLLGTTMDEVMKLKLENDAAAFMRTIATSRGRNVAVAESAVRESKSFTEREALAQKMIDVVAPDVPTLIRAIDGRRLTRFSGSASVLHVANKPVRELDPTVKERVLGGLMDPNIAFILFAIGAMALWAEFSHPGAVVPAVVGIVAMLLAAIAFELLPVSLGAVALLLVAMALFALEAKFASHGVLGAGGVVAMVFGAVLLVDGPIPEMRIRYGTAIAVAIPMALITTFLTTLVMRARRRPVATGAESMYGEIGIARTAFDAPRNGKVFVHGALWNATSMMPIEEGERVRVVRVDGLHVAVEPVTAAQLMQPAAVTV
jgi:membrane-bound serine protease (ClpP class)